MLKRLFEMTMSREKHMHTTVTSVIVSQTLDDYFLIGSNKQLTKFDMNKNQAQTKISK